MCIYIYTYIYNIHIYIYILHFTSTLVGADEKQNIYIYIYIYIHIYVSAAWTASAGGKGTREKTCAPRRPASVRSGLGLSRCTERWNMAPCSEHTPHASQPRQSVRICIPVASAGHKAMCKMIWLELATKTP